jgi:hypothetical protein
MEEQQHPHQCMICDQVREGMLEILNKYICLTCEKELSHSDAKDLRYAYYVWRLRALLVD